MNTFGVMRKDKSGMTYVCDVSKTERGAKVYATKHGYDYVGIRYNCGYIVKCIAYKVNNKWLAPALNFSGW